VDWEIVGMLDDRTHKTAAAMNQSPLLKEEESSSV